MELLENRPDIINVVKSVASEQGLSLIYRLPSVVPYTAIATVTIVVNNGCCSNCGIRKRLRQSIMGALKNCVISDVKTNAKGEGFMGEIFIITLTDPGSKNKLDIVIKAAFTIENVRAIGTSITKAYENEGHFYTTVYPTFKNFEQSKGITDQIELVPKCYKVCLDYKHEMLCFENLFVDGFEIFDKKKVLDDDHIELIFARYGRLHAYSFALRDQRPEEYNKIAKKFYNILQEIIDDEKTGFAVSCKEIAKFAGKSLVPGEDDEIIKKFEKYTSNEASNIFRSVVTGEDEYCVIIHGDCWSNNMMFKYENTENGKKLCDMRLLDLQVAKVGSPVCDLAYCLYTGGDENSFEKLDNYLKVYYTSFSSFLKKLGSDPEKLLPFGVLKDHWKKYSKFGMLMGTTILKTKFTEKEDIKDFSDDFREMSDLMEAVMAAKFDEKSYQKRIREILHHLYKLDAL